MGRRRLQLVARCVRLELEPYYIDSSSSSTHKRRESYSSPRGAMALIFAR